MGCALGAGNESTVLITLYISGVRHLPRPAISLSAHQPNVGPDIEEWRRRSDFLCLEPVTGVPIARSHLLAGLTIPFTVPGHLTLLVRPPKAPRCRV